MITIICPYLMIRYWPFHHQYTTGFFKNAASEKSMGSGTTCTQNSSEAYFPIPHNVTSVTTERGSFLVTTASERCELLQDTNIIVPVAQCSSATESPQRAGGIYTTDSLFTYETT
jgi:hypothetical protein